MCKKQSTVVEYPQRRLTMKQLEILIKRAETQGASPQSEVYGPQRPEEANAQDRTPQISYTLGEGIGYDTPPVSSGPDIPQQQGILSAYTRLLYDVGMPYLNTLWAKDVAAPSFLPELSRSQTAVVNPRWKQPFFGKEYRAWDYPKTFERGPYGPGKLATGFSLALGIPLTAFHSAAALDSELPWHRRTIEGGMGAANAVGAAGAAMNALQYGRWKWPIGAIRYSGAANLAYMAASHYADTIDRGVSALNAHAARAEDAYTRRANSRPTDSNTPGYAATLELEQWLARNPAATINDLPGDADRTNYDLTHRWGRDWHPSWRQISPVDGTWLWGHTPVDPVRKENLKLRQAELDSLVDEQVAAFPDAEVEVPMYPSGLTIRMPVEKYLRRYADRIKKQQEHDLQFSGQGYVGNALEHGGVHPSGASYASAGTAPAGWVIEDPLYTLFRDPSYTDEHLRALQEDDPETFGNVVPHILQERAAARAAAAKAEREEQAEKEYWDNMAEALKDHWF